MINLMGIGLRGTKSITLQKLEVLKNSDIIYFDVYTSISPENTILSLEKLLSKKIVIADRETIENSEEILQNAKKFNVTLMVTGDALTATTHNEIREEAMKNKIETRVYENASIFTAFPARTGLFNYKFGNIVSLPFVHENFFPLSVYDKIYRNHANDMHTLLLLDLNNGKTMGLKDAIQTLLKMEDKRGKGLITGKTPIIIGIRVGMDHERIIFTDIKKIVNGMAQDLLDESPISIIIPAGLNDKELEFIKIFCENELV